MTTTRNNTNALTMRALTDAERSQIKRAVHGIVETIMSDLEQSAQDCGEPLTNAGLMDCVCDSFAWQQEHVWPAARVGPELMAKWQRIPYQSRVRWLCKECRYV